MQKLLLSILVAGTVAAIALPAVSAPAKPAKPKPSATPARPAAPVEVRRSEPAAPAQPNVLTTDQMPQGNGFFSLSGQLTSTHGLVGVFRTGLNMGPAELGASLSAPPASPLSFFNFDGHLLFVGQTGTFLPINLMPVMGFGMGGMFRDLPGSTSPITDTSIWMHMPLGLRYVFATPALIIGTEATYYLPALYLMKGQSDVSRWHFEANARTGPLLVGAYYELGPVYNGPGLRAGIVF